MNPEWVLVVLECYLQEPAVRDDVSKLVTSVASEAAGLLHVTLLATSMVRAEAHPSSGRVLLTNTP
jgi:hypothetical protein